MLYLSPLGTSVQATLRARPKLGLNTAIEGRLDLLAWRPNRSRIWDVFAHCYVKRDRMDIQDMFD